MPLASPLDRRKFDHSPVGNPYSLNHKTTIFARLSPRHASCSSPESRTESAAMGTFLVSFLAVAAGLVEATFVSIGGQDGVAVYLRKDSAAIELAAVGEFEAPPAEVQAALLDYGAHVRINKHLAESTVLSRTPGEELVDQHLKLPVIKDRDFTLRVRWNEGKARGITFSI